MTVIPETLPQKEAEEIYWKFSEFENLTTDEIKKCCNVVFNKLMENSDTLGKIYWGEAKMYIKNRGI